MRRGLTDAEGHEAWAAWERGMSFYRICQAFNVHPSILRQKWGSMGYPRGAPRTRPARKWLPMCHRLASELGFTESEIIWGALKLVDEVALQALIHAAHTNGELTPRQHRSRERWLRASYKNRMKAAGTLKGPPRKDPNASNREPVE